MKKVAIFTDGACKGNPGPGGWGAIMQYEGHERCLKGFERNTTNNRMELLAVIEALKVLKSRCEVTITTDSQYVKNGISQWIHGWKKRGWKTASGSAVKNKDLWLQLEAEVDKHDVDWQWVKGHSGHRENELADELANLAIAEG